MREKWASPWALLTRSAAIGLDSGASRSVVLPSGATKLLPFWDDASRSAHRDWHEDGPRAGDEEWEETLVRHLTNSSVRWINLNGWATTINWRRGA